MRLTSDNYVFSMNKENDPAIYVDSGDRLKVETNDCFSGDVKSEADVISEIDFERVNPATGPIYINDAKAGDVLKVTIHAIELADTAVAMAVPELGLLGDQITEEATKLMPILDNQVEFNGKRYPLNKMVGVIGTAPAGTPVETGTPGDHGGNLDCQLIAEGSMLYLPVGVDGALLAIGDAHAMMGDGEICGTGGEIATVVDLTVEVVKDMPADILPLVETDNVWATLASAETMEDASKKAVANMAKFYQARTDSSLNDTNMFLSLFGNLKVCQVVNPTMTMRFEMKKAYL